MFRFFAQRLVGPWGNDVTVGKALFRWYPEPEQTALEALARIPQYQLSVGVAVNKEGDFEAACREELYHTSKHQDPG